MYAGSDHVSGTQKLLFWLSEQVRCREHCETMSLEQEVNRQNTPMAEHNNLLHNIWGLPGSEGFPSPNSPFSQLQVVGLFNTAVLDGGIHCHLSDLRVLTEEFASSCSCHTP